MALNINIAERCIIGAVLALTTILAFPGSAGRTSETASISPPPDSGLLSCARCHDARTRRFLDSTEEYSDKIGGDVHALAGLECKDCHVAHEGARGEGARPSTHACKRCHEAVFDAYSAGGHMQAFKQLGFPHCLTCHSPHGMSKPARSLIEQPGGTNQQSCLACHFANSKHEPAVYRMDETLIEIDVAGIVLDDALARLHSWERFLPRFLRGKRERADKPEIYYARAHIWTHAVDDQVQATLDSILEVVEELQYLTSRARVIVLAGFAILLIACGAFVRRIVVIAQR